MKNMFKSNKKGFTLVELLAVIVILALLIVITVNTALPMMNDSKMNSMKLYAERVFSVAVSKYQTESMSSSTPTEQFSIASIMQQSDYVGCVKVIPSTDSTAYSIIMYSNKDNIKIEGYSKNGRISAETSTVVQKLTTDVDEDDYTATICAGTTGAGATVATYSSSTTDTKNVLAP